MATWTFLAADLRTNKIIGDIPLEGGVRMSKTLNGAGQLMSNVARGTPSGALPVGLLDSTRPAIRAIYGLRDSRPWWGGIIWGADYDSDDNAVNPLVCVDFLSYFDHRKVLEVLPALPLATSYVAGLSKIYTNLDQNDIVRGLISLAQSHTAGDIGIVAETTLSGILRTTQYDGFDMWYTGEALRNLTREPDGPDIAFDVSGPDTNGRPIRICRIGTPLLGVLTKPHRWDLGGNLLSYKWQSGGGSMSTRAFFEGTGVERGAKIAVAEDASLYADGWPLLETDDIDKQVVDDVKLLARAVELKDRVRRPTVTVRLRVRPDLPPQLGEFGVGDTGAMVIPAGVDALFPAGIEVPLRIGTVEVQVGDDGDEQIELTCGVYGMDVA